MKLFTSKKPSTKQQVPQLLPASTLDVYSFQDTTLSVSAEVTRHPLASGPFSGRESRLRVRIENAGETEVENLSVEAIAPEGTLLVDPGILFGTTRRHVRLPRLLPGKSVTYKLGIRAREGFRAGVLGIEVKETNINSNRAHCVLKVELLSSQ
jgi:hypothetical protein